MIEAPWHFPGSIMLYDGNMNWLFVGEFIWSDGITNSLIDHGEPGDLLPTVLQYKKSIESCLNLEISYVFAEHQEVFTSLLEIEATILSKIDYKVNRM